MPASSGLRVWPTGHVFETLRVLYHPHRHSPGTVTPHTYSIKPCELRELDGDCQLAGQPNTDRFASDRICQYLQPSDASRIVLLLLTGLTSSLLSEPRTIAIARNSVHVQSGLSRAIDPQASNRSLRPCGHFRSDPRPGLPAAPPGSCWRHPPFRCTTHPARNRADGLSPFAS